MVLRQSTPAELRERRSMEPNILRSEIHPQAVPRQRCVHKIRAVAEALRCRPGEAWDELPAEKYKLFEEVSPITNLTKDDPPVLLWYRSRLDAEITSTGIGIHHPLFGKALKDKMDALKIPCELNAGAGKSAEERQPGPSTS